MGLLAVWFGCSLILITTGFSSVDLKGYCFGCWLTYSLVNCLLVHLLVEVAIVVHIVKLVLFIYSIGVVWFVNWVIVSYHSMVVVFGIGIKVIMVVKITVD